MLTKHDIAGLLLYVAGLSGLAADSAFSDGVRSLFGTNSTTILAVLSVLGIVAGRLQQVYKTARTHEAVVAVTDQTAQQQVILDTKVGQ